jgi:hypothetical protein
LLKCIQQQSAHNLLNGISKQIHDALQALTGVRETQSISHAGNVLRQGTANMLVLGPVIQLRFAILVEGLLAFGAHEKLLPIWKILFKDKRLSAHSVRANFVATLFGRQTNHRALLTTASLLENDPIEIPTRILDSAGSKSKCFHFRMNSTGQLFEAVKA